MSIGNWDPSLQQDSATSTLDNNALKRFAQITDAELEQLPLILSASDIQRYAPLMQVPQHSWAEAANQFSDAELEQLMRFFTVAEALPGWQAGANSPVIWLGKCLKQRGTGISKDVIKWIKCHSDNRFLPHGPLL